MAGFEDRGRYMAKKCGQLLAPENNTQPTARKKMENSYSCNKLNSADNLKEAGRLQTNITAQPTP